MTRHEPVPPDFGLRTFSRPDRLPDRIAALLEDEIRSGRLTPGDRLPTEQQLAEHFSVSRSVVREAVSRLRSEGLVASRQGLGMFVTDAADVGSTFRLPAECLAKLTELHQLFELRIGVESEAAALAAVNRSAAQLVSMSSHLEALGGALKADNYVLEDQVQAETAFYREIAAASGNPFIVQFLAFLNSSVMPRLQSVIMKNTQAVERGQDVLKEHELVFQAIHEQNPEKARRAARMHFMNSAQRLAVRTTYLGDDVNARTPPAHAADSSSAQ